MEEIVIYLILHVTAWKRFFGGKFLRYVDGFLHDKTIREKTWKN